MMSIRMFCIAGDAGGAAAIAPVIETAVQEHTCEVHVYAYRQALSVFSRRGIGHHALSEDTSIADLERMLLQTGAEIVLAATSVNGVDLELLCIQAAKRLKVPSLSVLDFWSNYAARFRAHGGDLVVPDCVCVMDRRAATELACAGIPLGQISVSGQPAFDHLQNFKNHSGARARVEVRRELRIPDNQLLLLFVSQPLADFYGDNTGGFGHLGFTEHSTYRLLNCAVESISHEQAFTVVIKTHPRERSTNWSLAESKTLVDPVPRSTLEFCFAADLVVGMNSVALVEAAIVGRPVLSLQPGLRLPNSLPEGINTLFSDCVQQVADAIRSPRISDWGASLLSDGLATKKVIRLIERYVATSRGCPDLN
jgi:hypothetical protein